MTDTTHQAVEAVLHRDQDGTFFLKYEGDEQIYDVAMRNSPLSKAIDAYIAALTLPQVVKYVPVSDKLRTADWGHPNDDEPRGPELKEALRLRGDDRGQGLDGYWKWGFCAGFNAAASRSPTPAGVAGGVDASRDQNSFHVANAETCRVQGVAPVAHVDRSARNYIDWGSGLSESVPDGAALYLLEAGK